MTRKITGNHLTSGGGNIGAGVKGMGSLQQVGEGSVGIGIPMVAGSSAKER